MRLFYSGVFLLVLVVPYALGQPVAADPYRYARFSPSMAVIVVILVAALFFMAFFSIYIRRCNDPTGIAIPGARSRRVTAAAARGLDPAVIDKFPTFAYSAVKDLKIGKGALECAVCLCEFEEEETLRLLPKCDHVFHPDCIDAWLASHTTCPVCRADLANDGLEAVVVEVAEEEPQSLHDPSEEPQSLSSTALADRWQSDTERFTLRLPAEVRKQIMANRALNRATSMVVLPREGSSRRGYRRLQTMAKSDRWLVLSKFTDQQPSPQPKPPSFFSKTFSFKFNKQAPPEHGTSASHSPHPPPPPPL